MANNDLPQAGAELVLQGISEFLTNIAAATSGLTKLGTGLVELAGLSTRSATTFDSATNRITAATQRINTAGTGLVDKFGNDLKTISNEANQAAASVEQAASRVTAATGKIASGGGGAPPTGGRPTTTGADPEEINRQGAAFDRAGQSSLGFVRAITALVSANNLLNVGALNTVFNIGTMAASFDRMGTAGLALGGTIGVVLAGIGSLIGAYQNILSAGQAVVGTIVNVTKALIDQGVAAADTAIKSAAGYQQSLAFFEALTGAPIGDLERLNDKITAVAETTIFGMPKAAEAVNELGRAGQNTFQIIEGGALDATLALTTAANGEVNLADAAKSLTGVVGSYTSVINGALTPTVSFGRAADVITASAQLSRLSFNDMLVAWRQAGPVAASTKISVEDLGAVLAILSNAGESASIAGTSFKQVILDLEKPSQNAAKELDRFGVSLFTSQGAIRPLRDVVIDMNRAFGEQALATGKVTEEEQKHALAVIFGSRAALAANIITNQGVQAFDAMKASMEGVTAVDMANILLLPLNARMTILQNSVQALAINMAGPLVSAFSDVVNKGLEFVRAIPVDAVRTLGQAIVAIATNEGFGLLEQKISELASTNVAIFFTELLNVFRNIRSAIVDQIIPAIGDAVNRIRNFGSEGEAPLTEMIGRFRAVDQAIRTVAEAITYIIVGIADLVNWFRESSKAQEIVRQTLEGLAVLIGGPIVVGFAAAAAVMITAIAVARLVGQAVEGVIEAFNNQIIITQNLIGVIGQFGSFMEELGSAISDILGGIADAATETWNTFVDAIASAYDATLAIATDILALIINLLTAIIEAIVAMSEGWTGVWQGIATATVEIIGNIINAISNLGPTFQVVVDAASSMAQGFAQAWSNLTAIVGGVLTAISNQINTWIEGLAGVPLIGELIKGGGRAPSININFTPVGIQAVQGAATAISAAFTGVKASADSALASITTNAPRAITTLDNLQGRLRNVNDALAGGTAGGRPSGVGGPGASTGSGEYPVKPGGGGGGKGGKGRGAGAGPEDAYNKALDQAAEFADDLARTIQTAGLDAIQKLEDIARKAADSAATATREYYEKVSGIKDKAKEQISEIDTNTDISRRDRARKDDLQKQLAAQAQSRQFAREDRDNQLSDERAAQDRKEKQIQDILDRQFQLSQQNAATRRSREREDEDTAFKRKLDDEEKRQQKLEELRNKPGVRQTADDIRKIQSQGGFSKAISTDEVEKARLARQRATEDLVTARSRGRQDEDTRYEREQQQAAIDYKQSVDDKALALQQSRTAYDRARRRTDTIDDVNFAAQQKQEQQKLEDQIEDEGIKRRKDKIAKDRADSLAVAKREYEEKQQAIKDKAAEDAHTVLAGLDKTLEAAQNKIADKVPDIIKAGGDAMQPIMDEIVGNLTEQMGIVQSSAEAARDALGLAVGTREAVSVSGLVIDSMSDSIVTFTDGMTNLATAAEIAAEAITTAVNSVPGATPTAPTKSPPNLNSIPSTNPSDHYVPPTGVGGGIGGGPPDINALPSSQIVAPSASSVTVQNNTTYQVNASYADTQSPASIGLDLSALSAITQR